MARFKKPNPRPKTQTKPKSKLSRLRLRPLHWLRNCVLTFFAITIFFVFLFRFVPPPITPLMVLRLAINLTEGDLPNLNKKWKSLEKISPNLVAAVIASEDQLFLDHIGFDWQAIKSAFIINGDGHKKIGASTISQQTAKNLFLWPERSWTRKALEAYFTLLLEVFWSKRRIIEVYLNIIETGDGQYGAEAAAQNCFGISAEKLNRSQSALIAATLPNPRVWSPCNPTSYLLRRQNWILRQMNHLGPLSKKLAPP